MAKIKDLTRQKFGKLTILSKAEDKIYYRKDGLVRYRAAYNCLCDCGVEKIILSENIKSGDAKSCGCLGKSKAKNLLGKRFGKLVVVSRGENRCYYDDFKIIKAIAVWNCVCDCGNFISILSGSLQNGAKSCGCLKYEGSTQLEPNQTFNYLTTISYSKGKWMCSCICGKIIYTNSYYLQHNIKKSCGCKTEIMEDTRIKLSIAHSKGSFYEKSRDRIYASYKRRALKSNKSFSLDIQQFEKIACGNCFYCGKEPGLKSEHNRKFERTEKIPFIYNGIDRIDSSLGYDISNVVSSCILCNRSKYTRNLEEFLDWVNRLKIMTFDNSYKYDIISIPKGVQKTVNYIAGRYYNDGDLSVNDFYSMIVLPCYYCGDINSNACNFEVSSKRKDCKNSDRGYLQYNGLDRVDSNKVHNKDNVVPCCRRCNFSKGNLSLDQFNDWITRIKAYQNKKGVQENLDSN